MAGTEESRRSVGKSVKRDRLRAKYSVEAAASAGHLSHMTWRRIEKGETVQERSYGGVDKALHLPAGTTLRAVLGEVDLEKVFKEKDEQYVRMKVLERDRRILTDRLTAEPSDRDLSDQLAELNQHLSRAQEEYARMSGRIPWPIKESRKAAAGEPYEETLTTANVTDDESPSSEEVADPDEPILPLKTLRGLASLLPPEGLWKPLDADRVVTDIVDRLPNFSISELDRIIDAASKSRRAKAVEILREFDLLDPFQLRYRTNRYDDSVASLISTRTKYMRATEHVLSMHEKVTEAKLAELRGSSPENRMAVEQAEGERNRTVAEAKGLLALYFKLLMEIRTARGEVEPQQQYDEEEQR